MTSSATRNRRILTAMGAGLIGAGLFLTPAAAFADTGQTVVQTTDAGGDARANLRNVPTADLLAAGARINASTVTVFVDLSTAPTKAELDDAAARGVPYGGRYDYSAGLAVLGGVGVSFGIHNNQLSLGADAGGGDDSGPAPTPACVAYFGADRANNPVLQAPVVVTGATGELSATFSRADVNAVQSCFGGGATLTAGTQVAVSGANSDIQTPYKNILSGGVIVRDSAGAGPAVTLAN